VRCPRHVFWLARALVPSGQVAPSLCWSGLTHVTPVRVVAPSNVAPVRLALKNLAPVRFAPEKSAFSTFTPFAQIEDETFAPTNVAPLKPQFPPPTKVTPTSLHSHRRMVPRSLSVHQLAYSKVNGADRALGGLIGVTCRARKFRFLGPWLPRFTLFMHCVPEPIASWYPESGSIAV